MNIPGSGKSRSQLNSEQISALADAFRQHNKIIADLSSQIADLRLSIECLAFVASDNFDIPTEEVMRAVVDAKIAVVASMSISSALQWLKREHDILEKQRSIRVVH